jgi:hypothetical protein
MFTRALPVPTNAPQALKDLIAQQEQLQRDFLLLARQQRQTDPDDTNALQRLQAMSRELADRQRQLDRQLREQFPAYADLLNPQPPAIPQLQAALDATTVLLYHAFADKELLIVAVSRQAVRGYRVKVDPRTLENDLAEFQKLVAKPPLERTASERRKLPALGQRLYATLIKPAEPSLKNATTVLLCPEGALNQLPWGALVVAVDKQGRPTYWVERVAIGHYAVGRGVSAGEGGAPCRARGRDCGGVAVSAVGGGAGAEDRAVGAAFGQGVGRPACGQAGGGAGAAVVGQAGGGGGFGG